MTLKKAIQKARKLGRDTSQLYFVYVEVTDWYTGEPLLRPVYRLISERDYHMTGGAEWLEIDESDVLMLVGARGIVEDYSEP